MALNSTTRALIPLAASTGLATILFAGQPAKGTEICIPGYAEADSGSECSKLAECSATAPTCQNGQTHTGHWEPARCDEGEQICTLDQSDDQHRPIIKCDSVECETDSTKFDCGFVYTGQNDPTKLQDNVITCNKGN